MKQLSFLLLFITTATFAQQSYYDDTPVFLTGQELYDALQNKISQHNTGYTYGQFTSDLLITDQNPNNGSEVLLEYGFNDNDGDCTTDRTRSDGLFGGDPCEYNREHVFPRSSANPPMGDASNGSTGIVADPHNLRPTDVQRNGTRGSRKFTNGSGNSGVVGDDWYPGDEWKGDVARVAMYMYVRYGDRCLPSLIGTGPAQGDTDMLQLFLQWNAEDPVSDVEEQRNPHLENVYGNRNPFIDNPVLATIIWGGPPAEDIWGLLSVEENSKREISLFPNPANNQVRINSNESLGKVTIYNITGKKIFDKTFKTTSTEIQLNALPSGIYLIKSGNTTRKLIIN